MAVYQPDPASAGSALESNQRTSPLVREEGIEPPSSEETRFTVWRTSTNKGISRKPRRSVSRSCVAKRSPLRRERSTRRTRTVNPSGFNRVLFHLSYSAKSPAGNPTRVTPEMGACCSNYHYG